MTATEDTRLILPAPPAPAPDQPRRRRGRITPYGLLLPAVIILLVALGYPIVWQLITSMQHFGLAQQFGKPADFVWFENYITLFSDPYTWVVVARSIVFCLVTAFVTVGIGVGMALRLLRPVEAEGLTRFDFVGFVLVAVALVGIQAALEIVAADSAVGPAALLGLAIGFAACAAYGWHARRGDPILDLRLFRYRAFAVAVIGGSFSRLVLGATMFLFPLFFQLGLGGSAIVAGYLMAVLAFGQIALRLGLDPLLKRLGIKSLLIVNSAVLGLLLVSLLAFHKGDSFWLLGGFMFVFGLIHSIQLSTLAGLNFSGLPKEALGNATSVAAVVQRVSMALGISMTAILLGYASGGASATRAAFNLPTLVLAGTMALSLISFLALRPGDGDDLLKKAG